MQTVLVKVRRTSLIPRVGNVQDIILGERHTMPADHDQNEGQGYRTGDQML